jgi:drug/metabolite transporter (DMT)-like permease
MDAIALALASALAWGTADFFGGLLTRRGPVLGVSIVSQAFGFAAILAVWALRGFALDGHAFWLGLLAGVGGGIGLALLYQALALGTMSIVSPVVAAGAVVPFTISLATGERPSPLALAGAVAALCGAVLASMQEHRAVEANRRRAIVLAVGSALALGLFVYFVGLAGHGDTTSALLGARITSLLALGTVALVWRRPVRLDRRIVPAVAGVGLLDSGANALFTHASARGLLAIVSVLGALFPLMTVFLAHRFLGERITRVQVAGIAVALAGVALVSAF